MSVARLKDWRQRLDAWLDGCDGRAFEWGVLDCALFSAGAVEAMTGHDSAGALRGAYHDAVSAARLIRSLGFADLADLAANRYPEIPVAEARLGDIAAVATPEYGLALTVVGGAHLACMTPRGRGCLPLATAIRAFRIG